ncbi:MAG: hypothetical protein HY617_03360 [Candidatus Sungbacteria bacterium]|nr:hypothetical protein [Candidatus Sungbacteria bacterium]
MCKKIWFGVFAGFTLVMPLAVSHAAQYLPRDRASGGAVVVGGSQEFRNLYTGGGSVVVSKQVLGDLFVAGGSVTVVGPVEKDLVALGGNVAVVNPVGDDARIAGGNVTVNAPVAGDLLAAGGTITLTENARIGGDWWAAGGIINFNGTVAGGAKITGGDVFINGVIIGPIEVHANKKLTFGPQSRVSGSITYSGPAPATVQDGAQIGKIEFTPVYAGRTATRYAPIALLAGFGVFFFLKLAALLAASLILLKLFPRTSLEMVSSNRNRFWQNLGIGVAGIIVVPLAAILLIATVIGAYLGIALGIWFCFALIMTGIATVMLAGTIMQQWIHKKETALSWKTVLWGILMFAILGLIPFIGWLAIAILYLTAFGTLLRIAAQRIER